MPIRALGEVRVISAPGRRPVYPVRRIEKILSRHVGRTVDPGRIRRSLEDRYRFLGYRPVIRVAAPGGVLEAEIRESRFLLKLMTTDPGRLAEIGVARRGAPASPPGGLDPIPEWILLQNLLTDPGDHDNLERYRQERFRLARFGYDIAFIRGEAEAGTGFDTAAYLLVPRGAGGREGEEGESEPPDRNYLGGAVDYGPRRGATLRAVYRRWKWLTPFDSLTFSPMFTDEAGGELTYRTDYLLPESVARRNVSLSFRLFSEQTRDRIVNGVETDERREGLRAFFGVELIPEKKNHDLELGFEFERSNLELEVLPVVPTADVFALFRLTSKYTYRHRYRPPVFQFRAVPAAVFSVADLGGQVDFQLYSLDTDLHAVSRRRVEVDLHLNGGVMNGDVPPSEELRLGGARTVRGFEEDDFSGERMVALQSELWFPLSGGGPGANRFLSRLRGAVFLDAGAIRDGAGPSTDVVGAGAGIRYQMPRNPLYLKLDYGTGIHGGGDGDGHFYFTLAFRY